MFTPGAWPILDHDDDPDDAISRAMAAGADHRLPDRAVLTLLGGVTRRWAAEYGYDEVDRVRMISGPVPVWVGRYAGQDVALADLPVGAPAATIVLERLLLFGVRTVVAAGSCGALVPFEEGEFVVPTRALRDEGTSYHYLPAARWVDTDTSLRRACTAAIEDAGLTYAECATWTTDAFLRETPAVIAARRAQGCQVVDMECAALAAVAQFRGARFAQILYTADTLAGGHHDQRTWGRAARPVALQLALEAATRG
ncbi:MAG: nucleoside phosphorylase [Austwickia sp.]|nr:nucleoside phosphorylase [Austwickia sp.]MBK8436610.1 nucleoside phosphorylase [Austwickia sp.]MBK9102275.1 nucleoside phosphorylase [Austwickia sp.]